MPDLNLTQSEADALIALEKHRIDNERSLYPGPGGSLALQLQSPDKREQFILDISRGRIDLSRGKYQNRARQAIVLLRLDFGGPPHRNPDDQEIPCPHLHIYREGYGDKWACPIPAEQFSNPDDLWVMLQDFMRYCNITQAPHIDKNLMDLFE